MTKPRPRPSTCNRSPPPRRTRCGLDAQEFRTSGFGYFLEQATRPQTIGFALLDSPVALAAWMLDHDTDAYYKISRAFTAGQPSGGLSRDHILDNITVYWLTGTGASAARSYWEHGRAQALAAGQAPPEVKLPVGFTVFPGKSFRWACRATSWRSVLPVPDNRCVGDGGLAQEFLHEPAGWGYLLQLRCLVVCCCWLDLLCSLGAADSVAVAWPVSGILVGRPHVRAGSAARSAASRLAVCIAMAVHGGFMR
jgi:hypothetical protein